MKPETDGEGRQEDSLDAQLAEALLSGECSVLTTLVTELLNGQACAGVMARDAPHIGIAIGSAFLSRQDMMAKQLAYQSLSAILDSDDNMSSIEGEESELALLLSALASESFFDARLEKKLAERVVDLVGEHQMEDRTATAFLHFIIESGLYCDPSWWRGNLTDSPQRICAVFEGISQYNLEEACLLAQQEQVASHVADAFAHCVPLLLEKHGARPLVETAKHILAPLLDDESRDTLYAVLHEYGIIPNLSPRNIHVDQSSEEDVAIVEARPVAQLAEAAKQGDSAALEEVLLICNSHRDGHPASRRDSLIDPLNDFQRLVSKNFDSLRATFHSKEDMDYVLRSEPLMYLSPAVFSSVTTSSENKRTLHIRTGILIPAMRHWAQYALSGPHEDHKCLCGILTQMLPIKKSNLRSDKKAPAKDF